MQENEKAELNERRTIEKAQELGDKRYAFKPVEWIVYGMVASILLAFITALISNVITEKHEGTVQSSPATLVQ